MAQVTLNNSGLGNSLQTLLMAEDIEPGDDVSYQVCKTIYDSHPLGAKIADNPIAMAQSQKRKVTVQSGPEEKLTKAFLAEWKAINADKVIFNIARLARIYGIATLALVTKDVSPAEEVDWFGLHDAQIAFNCLDPLNTAGSLVLNQDPNALDFQKVTSVSVSGKSYSRSRTVVMMHEDPLYIKYEASSFGFVGRSVYKRALYPLKSFINTQVTNDMVSAKAGLLIVKEKQQSSAMDGIMAAVAAVKRALLSVGQVGNILQVGTDDEVESLNLQNLEGPFMAARKNILEDIASAAGTPAQIINSETFAEGFGEGAEDAKRVAAYIQRIRAWLEPLYDFMTKVVQHRAWNAEFYSNVQKEHPEDFGGVEYKAALYKWQDDFVAEWPSLIEEPDSEKVKVPDVQLKAIISLLQVLLPEADPENKAVIVEWACDNINAMALLFTSPLNLDYEAMAEYEPPNPLMEPKSSKPEGIGDAVAAFTGAVDRLKAGREKRAA